MSSFTCFFTYQPGSSGEVEIEINGPSGATDIVPLPKWVTDVSAAHTRIVYKTTDTDLQQWTIALTNLTVDMYNDLEDFFDNTVEGPTNTFTYTHTDGTEYTNCRFVDTSLPATRNDNNLWSVTIRLEKSGKINS